MSSCPASTATAHLPRPPCAGDGMVGARQERLCDGWHGSGYGEGPECQGGREWG
jgi:hypothetical protein